MEESEFPQNFLVKLYYKYHEIIAQSFTIPPDDMDSYQKWMSANINYHLGFRKIGQDLRNNFRDASVSKITNFKMERMQAIRQHKEQLDTTFLEGFGEIQKEMLNASRQAQMDYRLPSWAQLPAYSEGGQPEIVEEEEEETMPQLEPVEPTTSSATNFGQVPETSWTLEPIINQNELTEQYLEKEDDEDVIYLAGSASPDVIIISPGEPENNTPDHVPEHTSLSNDALLQKAQAKLQEIQESLEENARKLLDLRINQKPEILAKIQKQEEILKEIGKDRRAQKKQLSKLKKLKKEQEALVKVAEKDVEMAEKDYQDEVAKSKEFHSKIFAPEISGNILSDAADCIDAMDDDGYNTYLFYMNSRRTLKTIVKDKQEALENAKNGLLVIPDQIEKTQQKLEEIRQNEEEEIEKMRMEEGNLEDIEEEAKDLKDQKLVLEKQEKEQEKVIERCGREIAEAHSNDISSVPSPDLPPELELHNEDIPTHLCSASSFDSLDAAPMLSPHYPSSLSFSPSSPTASSTDPNTHSSSSGPGFVPVVRSVNSKRKRSKRHGAVGNRSTQTLKVKLFIPSSASYSRSNSN